jgi:integrase
MEGKTPEWVGARLGAPVIPPAPITDLFTSEQQSAIVTATKTARDRACVLLLLRAGVRKGELRHMQVRDINLADKYVLVRRGKGSKFRRVPVKGSLVRALDLLLLEHPPGLSRQLRDDEYVLYANQQGKPGPDGPRANPRQGMSDTATHRWWYQRLADAGIVDVDVTRGRRMHATRHTYATDLGKANKWSMGAMMALQKNLGHARIQTTVDIYTQFAYSEQEAAVELLPEIEGA